MTRGIQHWRVTEVKQGLKGEDSYFYCDSWHSTALPESWEQHEEQEQVRFTAGIRVITKPFLDRLTELQELKCATTLPSQGQKQRERDKPGSGGEEEWLTHGDGVCTEHLKENEITTTSSTFVNDGECLINAPQRAMSASRSPWLYCNLRETPGEKRSE